MIIWNATTELQLKFRPDEVEPFIDFVLNSPPSRFKRDLVDMLRKECLL